MSEERVVYSSKSEGIKFIILVVVLLGTVLVIALLRPLIFERIVPAIIGQGAQTPGQQSIPQPDPVQVEPSEVTEPVGVETPEAAEATDVFIPAVEADEPADTAGEVQADAMPTVGTESTPAPTITHTVQPGENLTTIARRYNVSVDSIVAANNISNPNRIEAGTTLVIPQP